MNRTGKSNAQVKRARRRRNRGGGTTAASLNTDQSSSARVSAPVSRALKTRTSRPQLNGRGAIVVKHTEYIGDIAGSVGFNATAFSVNPGLTSAFPWLSRMAKNYESYKFRKLHFRFETEQSTASNGTVMGAMEYDAADAAPVTKQQLMSYEGAVRSPLWDCWRYDCQASDMQKLGRQKFVRTGALASNLDIKTYDLGTFYVATKGCADTSLIGELYVDYEVEFETPQFEGSNLFSQKLVTSGAVTGAAPLGTSVTSTGDEIFEWTTSSTMTCRLTGEYLIESLVNGAGTAVTAMPIYTPSAGSASSLGAVYNATNTVGMGSSRIQVAAGDVVTVAGTATSYSGLDYRISSYAYSNA